MEHDLEVFEAGDRIEVGERRSDSQSSPLVAIYKEIYSSKHAVDPLYTLSPEIHIKRVQK